MSIVEQIIMEAKIEADYAVAMARTVALDEEARIRREQEQAEQERKASEEARKRRLRRRNYYA